jgi:EmrB/QacA subfamily drug resistance transporter
MHEQANGTPITQNSGASVRAEAPTEGHDPRRWMALSILLVAGFMDLLDTSIVNVAIPSIRGHLHASYSELQWMVAGYLLAVAVGLITGGRLGDIAGRKRVFLVGVLGFGLTSLGSGLAPVPSVLVTTRILQGLSAAVMIPQILSFIQVSFSRQEKTRALGLYSSIAGVAVMSGPLMAGVLLDVLGWSWRSIFLINVPVSVCVIGAALAIVPESKAREAQRVDLGGIGLVSLGLFALVFGTIEGRELGWPIWVFVMIAAAPLIFWLFALYERRVEDRGGSPLVSPTLFRLPAFSPGLLVVVVFFAGIIGFFLAFTVFLQLGLGFTPLDSALTTFPSSVGLVVSSQIGAKLVPRFGWRILSVGALIMAVAMVGLIFTVKENGASLTAWDVRPVIFVFGFGMGLILPSLADTIIGGIPEHHAGAASGVINTGMQVGNAIGVALIGVILFSAISSNAPRSATRVEPALSAHVSRLGLPAAARRGVLDDFRACFVATAREKDPAAVPSSCGHGSPVLAARATSRRLATALSAATKQARIDSFVGAIQSGLLYEVGIFAATFFLLFLLPRRASRAPHDESDGPGISRQATDDHAPVEPRPVASNARSQGAAHVPIELGRSVPEPDVVVDIDAETEAAIRGVAQELAAEHRAHENVKHLDDHELMIKCGVALRHTSADFVAALRAFRLSAAHDGVMLLRGVPIDEQLPGTPTSGAFEGAWGELAVSTVAQLMIMNALGDVIAYADEKSGHVVQDICPVPGAESRQENTGCVLLELHTEDAFHPHKPHFLSLLCLRADRERKALTVAASARAVLTRLDPGLARILREPLFRIRFSSSFVGPTQRVYTSPMSVLSGSVSDPDICVDFHAMEGMTDVAVAALDDLRNHTVDALVGTVLEPGDMLIIDNRRAAHGRSAFSPRFDGEDRWLRRCFAITDLRAARATLFPQSRVHRPLEITGEPQSSAGLPPGQFIPAIQGTDGVV